MTIGAKLHDQYERIAKDVESGLIITQSEMIIFIAGFAKLNPSEQDEDPRRQPFSVVWFDPEAEESVIVRVEAENSIDAINMVESQVPPCVNVSAYSNYLPKTLRFQPDFH